MNLGFIRQQALAQRDRLAPSNTVRVRSVTTAIVEGLPVVTRTVLTNFDGGFPRVQRLSDSQRLLVPGVSETSTVFRVRVVTTTAPSTTGYELSFDGGVSWQGVRLLGSAYRDVGNNAWVFNLERGV